MSTLLETALEAPARQRRETTFEEMELAIAFMQGKLTHQQVAHALGLTSTGAISGHMVRILRNGIIAGQIAMVIR